MDIKKEIYYNEFNYGLLGFKLKKMNDQDGNSVKKMRFSGIRKRIGAVSLSLSLIAASGMTAGLFTVTGCGLFPEEETFAHAPVVHEYEGAVYKTTKVKRGLVELYESLSVTYVPLQSENLSFGITGIGYGDFYVGVGDAVKKGDVLGVLDLADLEEQIAQSEEQAEELKLSIKQNEEMRSIKLREAQEMYADASSSDRDEALSKINEQFDTRRQGFDDRLTVIDLKIESLKNTVAERQIIAPFDGTVIYIYETQVGELSDRTKTVMRIADSTMSLFRGSTENWNKVNFDAEYTIEVAGNTFTAHAVTEEELGIPETPHVEGEKGYVYFALNENSYAISDKASGRVRMMLDEKEDVLYVPNTAVTTMNDKTILYYPKETGIRYYKEVEVGLVGTNYTEIISGVDEGQEVIYQ